MAPRILLVEDDAELREMVTRYLQLEGFAVQSCADGETGLLRAQNNAFEALILDVMLPQKSGFEVLRLLRADPQTRKLPVVMLTARSDEFDRVLGLEMGADDYLPKPFSSRELVARLRAVLRRSGSGEVEKNTVSGRELVVAGEFELDVAAQTAWRAGQRLDLTALEFRLLEIFMRHAGAVVTREQIAHEVLGRALLVYDRSVDTHISNLRRKIGATEDNDPLRTVRGTGYILTLPALGNPK